jgi:hypothetical protein
VTAQGDRDLTVAAFLDLTLGQWESWATALTNDQVAQLEADGLDWYVADVIAALRDQAAGEDDDARARYLRVMASLADETMARFVREVSA